MLLDLDFVLRRPLEIAGIILAILILKLLTSAAGAAVLRIPPRTMLASALLLAQIGEFSFVLERAGRTWNLSPAGMGEEGTQLLIAATAILMMLTPFLASVGGRIETSGARVPREIRRPPEERDATAFPSEVQEPSGHVIIAGYGNAARYLARVLRDTGVPFVVVTLSPEGMTEIQRERDHVIGGDYAKRMILQQAGIERAKMLVIPDDEPERSATVASVAKALNPAVRVISRTRRLADVDEIVRAGADQVIPEELEGAVELFGRVLAEYEIGATAVERYKSDVRRDHYAAVVAESDAPIVVCDELDQACLNRRTVTIAAGSAADGMDIGQITAPLRVTRIERAGKAAGFSPGTVLRVGDVVTIEGPADDFVAILDRFRVTPLEAEWVELSDEQRRSPNCAHAGKSRRFPRPPLVCPECRKLGDRWVHLRICMTCGEVGCCDSSKNSHASAHARATEHPIIRSLQPGESWAWCFRDQSVL